MVKKSPDQGNDNPFLIPGDLSIFLDFLEDAAVLIQDGVILAVNSKATELTAYTRQELKSQPLSIIIKNDIEYDSIINQREYHNRTSDYILSTRYGTNILVKTESRYLLQDLFLFVFKPSQIEDDKNGTDHSSKSSSNVLDIIQSTQVNDPQLALLKSLEAGARLLEATTIALYIGNSKKPSVRRIAFSGKIDIFPLEIYPIDIRIFIKPTIWNSDHKAITTILHQEATASGLSYLATCPVGDQESNVLIGALVAGGYQKTPSSNYLDNMRILSESISNIITKNVLISNLKNTIDENKKSISLLNSLIKHVQDGVISISPSYKVMEINPAAEVALGYHDTDIRGADISEVIVGNEDIFPAIEIAMHGKSTSDYFSNLYLRRRDGTEFPAILNFHPMEHKDNIHGVYIVIQDKSEHEFYQIKASQLEQRALLGEVTSIFAHEVRNPINNISTGLQLLAEEVKGDVISEDIIKRIHQDCIRLDSLMESVLTISRTGNYKFASLDIGELLDNLVLLWKPRIIKYNIETILTIPSEEILVYADRRALEQVFTNLITNAIQAMEEMKGGTLAVKLSKIGLPNERKFVQIDISDTGCGISPKNRNKIFEPFFSTKQKGTGLGLPITKQIITAHKGSINLTSFPGGTIFHVKLPVHNIKENIA